MGEVVRLKDFQRRTSRPSRSFMANDLVPIEFACGYAERHLCLAKLADYGVGDIQVRMVNNEPRAHVYLMKISDALWLNKKILELEDLSEESIADRIDLIQALENMNVPMLQNLWHSFAAENTPQR